MLLSVVIVNYKVPCFLIQTMYALHDAKIEFEKQFGTGTLEIFMVDNRSEDESVSRTKELFPQVKVVENQENTGFSAANNQALKQAVGKYKLLLNPDTLIPKNALTKTVSYLEQHPEIGTLGVRLTDIHGQFAPESKRSVPKPTSAFFKMFGLSKLFPNSKFFGQYQLTYLPEFEINKIEVITGAFMLLRGSALEKAGLLDESFFMYGEDIDLSFRILKAGYENVYFPEISIIHYKGESAKQNTKHYISVFYGAMLIFAKKHYSKFQYFIYALFIYFAKFLKIISLKTTAGKTESNLISNSLFIGINPANFQKFKSEFKTFSDCEFADFQNVKSGGLSFQNYDNIIVCLPEIAPEFIIELSKISLKYKFNIRSYLSEKNCLI